MRVPPEFEKLGVATDGRGHAVGWSAPRLWEPLGYLPCLGEDNGDSFGLYWPIGGEDGAPIVCEFWHDDLSLHPRSGSAAGFARYLVAAGRSEWLAEEAAVALGVELAGGEDDARSHELSGPRHASLDPSSPEALVALAREEATAGALEPAEQHLRRALALLPEFGSARIALAQILRRRGDRAGSAEALVAALASPRCFGGDKRRVLNELRRVRDEDASSVAGDPLWLRRHQLRFEDGHKETEDYALLEEAIAAYLARGDGRRAIWLRVLYGERIVHETVSFRERQRFDEQAYRARLRLELAQAGLHARLPAMPE